MNPGKVVDPYPPDANLKWSPQNYHPATVQTYFRYPNDNGSFAKAANRCVGVGKCRRESGGTMCPSYMATREETYSTRGRARLLYEMLEGDVVADGWRDEGVFDALDMCLACKGCRTECPVNVDMATYKAEFLAHYYQGRLRPRTAYTMGLIYWWARLASHMPSVANFFTQTWPLSAIMKFGGGIAPERRIPPFANPTFVDWFRNRASNERRRPTTRNRSKATEITHGDVPRFQSGTYEESNGSGSKAMSGLNPYAHQAALRDEARHALARYVYQLSASGSCDGGS